MFLFLMLLLPCTLNTFAIPKKAVSVLSLHIDKFLRVNM